MISTFLNFFLFVCGILIISSILFWVCVFKWQDYKFSYWSRRNVISAPASYFVGSCHQIIFRQNSMAEELQWWHQMLFKATKVRRAPVLGVYVCHTPALLLRDLPLIKMVFITNAEGFMNRTWRYIDPKNPLEEFSTFYAREPYWKELRDKLLPYFTTDNIKSWYPGMCEIGEQLEVQLRALDNHSIIELREICSRFTLDMISKVAFGSEPDEEFRKQCNAHRELIGRAQSFLKCCLDIANISLRPDWSIGSTASGYTPHMVDYLRNRIGNAIFKRKLTGAVHKDFVDVLMEMRNETDAESDDDDDDLANWMDYLVGQAAMFHASGYETCTATIMFALYELALNPKLQQRLRNEIRQYINYDACIPFESLLEMPLMAQVVNETLRKYPPVAFLERQCTASNPSRASLVPHLNYVVPEGMTLFVSVLGIHRDPRYWASPELFNPNRFAPKNKERLNMDAFMPFGLGPRNCLGYLLSMVQVKLFLVHFLRRQRILKCSRTVADIKFDPVLFHLTPGEPIYLRLDHI